MDPFIGETGVFGFNFVPRGCFACDGCLLAIAQYSAPFGLLQTFYNGDGVQSFALPNLCGHIRIAMRKGLSIFHNYALGEYSNLEFVTLTADNLSSHTHGLMATTAEADSDIPSGAVLANVRSKYLPETGVDSHCKFTIENRSCYSTRWKYPCGNPVAYSMFKFLYRSRRD